MFLHLITLCMGLLIAAGLQQIYEYIQRRRRNRAMLEAERKAAAAAPSPPDPPPASQP
jgi:hypothetical protein